mmetsp:Transcript_58883/g.140242  ORF Transcript_58883/g.140242 Transcript_58883/m.140242 type:complete len:130 (+) Transcript_58883:65-454(+)
MDMLKKLDSEAVSELSTEVATEGIEGVEHISTEVAAEGLESISETAGAVSSMVEGAVDAQKAVLEKSLEKFEQRAGEIAPDAMEPCFPWCGGPVNTLKTFEFVIPEDSRDEFQVMYTMYTKAKEELDKL